MANELAIIEREIDNAMPTLANILAATPGLPAHSFKAALLSQLSRNDRAANAILQCSLPSILNCACTFSGLGLMPDGVSGQAYILAFKQIATPVIGYMGYNTLGDRAGRTINGNVWRDGDDMDWSDGSDAFVKHKQSGPPGDRRILGAWATASATNRMATVSVIFLEELEQTRLRSPAVKFGAKDTPWNDLAIGRPAMYAKTAKRRLKRSMPLVHGSQQFLTADVVEGKFEATDRPHYLLPGQDGTLKVTDGITGEPADIRPPTDTDPTATIKLRAKIDAEEGVREFASVNEWKMALLKIISLNVKRLPALKGIQSANAPYLAEANTFGGEYASAALDVSHAISTAISVLEKK